MKEMKLRNLLFPALLSAMISGGQHSDSQNSYHFAVGGYNPIFTPRRTKFKGYMRENRRFNSFNKKKR